MASTRIAKSNAKKFGRNSPAIRYNWNDIPDLMDGLGFGVPDVDKQKNIYYFKTWKQNNALIAGDKKKNVHVSFPSGAWHKPRKIHIFHITDGRKTPHTHWYFDVDYQSFCKFRGSSKEMGQHQYYDEFAEAPNKAAGKEIMDVWETLMKSDIFLWNPELFALQQFHQQLLKKEGIGFNIKKTYYPKVATWGPKDVVAKYEKEYMLPKKKRTLEGWPNGAKLEYNDILDQFESPDGHYIRDYDNDNIDYMIQYQPLQNVKLNNEYSQEPLASQYLSAPYAEPSNIMIILLCILFLIFCWIITCVISSACGFIIGRGVTKKSIELEDIEANDSQIRI